MVMSHFKLPSFVSYLDAPLVDAVSQWELLLTVMILLIFIKYEQPNLNQGAFETSVRASVPEFMHYFTPAKTLFRLHVHYSGNLTELPLEGQGSIDPSI